MVRLTKRLCEKVGRDTGLLPSLSWCRLLLSSPCWSALRDLLV